MSSSQAYGEGVETVLLSALQHYSYCPRQCALIYLEQVFDENLYTLRGRAVHQNVDQPGTSWERGLRVERALPLWSRRLGLRGKADLVEFHGTVPFPVEFKYGPRRRSIHDNIQVCAQAFCLEEMLGVPVPAGAIYHYSSRRRRVVKFTLDLRGLVVDTVSAVRAMLKLRQMPPPANDGRCKRCSLKDSCLPGAVGRNDIVKRLARELFSTGDDSLP